MPTEYQNQVKRDETLPYENSAPLFSNPRMSARDIALNANNFDGAVRTINTFTAGETLSAGDAVYLSSLTNTFAIDLELSSSQNLSITDAAQTGLDVTGNFSIEAWIKLEQLPSAAGTRFMIVTKYDQNTAPAGYQFFIDTSNQLTGEFTNGAGGLSRAVASVAFDSTHVTTWMHVAMTANVAGASIALYKDGSVFASTMTFSTAVTIAGNTVELRIGAGTNIIGTSTEYFDGKIDDVRFWSVLRTAGEIQLYYRQIIVAQTNLQGYWKLDNALTDTSGNANTLTNNGAATFTTDIPYAQNNSVFKASAASALTSSGFIGFAKMVCQIDEDCGIVIVGQFDGYSGLTQGTTYYLSDTAGQISSTPGTVSRKVGLATASDKLIILNII